MVIQEQIFDFLHTKHTRDHLGINESSSSSRQRFWWPGIKIDVVRWCKHCKICQRQNILSLPVEMTQGNTCILVLCDYFTKWVEAFALSDHNTPSNADVLLTEVFLWFVVPRLIFLIKHQSSC